jgi:polyisoprenoid-binding protein YceI
MTTATQQQIPTGTWTIDPVHSSASFNVEHNGLSAFSAGFGEVDAALSVTEDGAHLSGSARVESVGIEDPQLRGHLLSPEFFDTERHPEIGFASDDIRVGDGGELHLKGELTIRGATKPIEAHGTFVGPHDGPDGKSRLGLSLETVVDRTDYGLGWNMELPDGRLVLGNDVTLVVRLELVGEGA